MLGMHVGFNNTQKDSMYYGRQHAEGGYLKDIGACIIIDNTLRPSWQCAQVAKKQIRYLG